MENITVRPGYLRNLRIVSNADPDRRGASRRVTMPCLAPNRKDLPDNSGGSDPASRPRHPPKPLQCGLIVTASLKQDKLSHAIVHYIAS
jgi:hypothetical protein